MKRKKLNYTKDGYSYLECTENDCYNWGGASICDFCGEKIHDTVYLIFILGMDIVHTVSMNGVNILIDMKKI